MLRAFYNDISQYFKEVAWVWGLRSTSRSQCQNFLQNLYGMYSLNCVVSGHKLCIPKLCRIYFISCHCVAVWKLQAKLVGPVSLCVNARDYFALWHSKETWFKKVKLQLFGFFSICLSRDIRRGLAGANELLQNR